MEIYHSLPYDIKHKMFIHFRHPVAKILRKRNHDILIQELKEYNTFKSDILEKINTQSYLNYYDFIDIHSVCFSIGWYTTSQRWVYKYHNCHIIDFLQDIQSLPFFSHNGVNGSGNGGDRYI
jgi:hypothetical protein